MEDEKTNQTGMEVLGQQTELVAMDATKAEVPAPAVNTETTPVTPVSYTEDELNKRINDIKNGYTGTIKKVQDDLRVANEAKEKALQDAKEASYSKFLQEIADKGLDVDAAKAIVATQKAQDQREKALAEKEADLSLQLELLNIAGKSRKVDEFITSYKLPDTARAILEDSNSPEEMELKALRMVIKGQGTVKPMAQQPDSGVKTGRTGIDWNNLSDDAKLGFASEQIMRK